MKLSKPVYDAKGFFSSEEIVAIHLGPGTITDQFSVKTSDGVDLEILLNYNWSVEFIC